MTVPSYEEFMAPLLKWSSHGGEKKVADAHEAMSKHFKLSEEDCRELLPSGHQLTYKNRIGWAKTYLAKAGLLKGTRRGYFQITGIGQEVLSKHSGGINTSFLGGFESFREFRTIRPESGASGDQSEESVGLAGNESGETPEETLDRSYSRLKFEMGDQILATIKSCSPAFFEQLVVDLLVQMGYGGSRREAGQAIGGTADGGIDGIIKEDRLGLDVIYLQAKRWENTVGRPDIQKFAGALQGQRARKGVFITTSNFSREALDFVSNIESKIILIDGKTLVGYMMEHGVGVITHATYVVHKIDEDYFESD